MSPKKVVYTDPDFADEMAAQAQARREEREADNAEFQEAWQKRLETPVPAVHPSALHQHEEDCWEAPSEIVFLGTRIKIRRCKRSGATEEVK